MDRKGREEEESGKVAILNLGVFEFLTFYEFSRLMLQQALNIHTIERDSNLEREIKETQGSR